MSIKICLSGSSGRMGKTISEVIKEFPELTIAHEINSRTESESLRKKILESDIVVDFSTPKVSLKIAEIVAETSTPFLVGTTGFNSSELEVLKNISKKVAILIVPNTSVAVIAMKEMVSIADSILPESVSVGVVDIHHEKKIDKPSGTAKFLVSDINNRKVGITSLRVGNVIGEHRVSFYSIDEEIELIHRVTNRKVFARGALILTNKLFGMTPKLYDATSLLVGSLTA